MGCGAPLAVLPALSFLHTLEEKPKGGGIHAASCTSAHRFPHVYLARRVSTKVLLVRWHDFGSETLRPELFVEVTDVGRAQESELRCAWGKI